MNARRFIKAHLGALSATLLLPLTAMAAPPPNDNFAAPTNLGVLATLNVPGTTAEATLEAGEPRYAGSNRSVWYRWTAPATGLKRVAVDSTSTTIANDPAVTVFEGSSITALTPVCNDLPGNPYARFNAVAGRVYYFHVLERGSSGPYELTLGAGAAPTPPANDNFANATTVTAALPRSVSGTFIDSSVERREPSVYVSGSSAGRGTVWYRWTPPAGTSWIDVYLLGDAPSSGFRFFTGGSLSTLVEFLPRYIDASFPYAYYQVTPGTAYYIQVYQREEANRTFSLNIDPIPAPAFPANDAFTARRVLPGTASVSRLEETSVDATTENGEPLPFAVLTGTVWYSWTAPATGTFEFKTIGAANHDTLVCVYTGSDLASLKLQTYNDDIDVNNGNFDSSVVLNTIAGTAYQIQVGSAYAARDTFALTIAPVDSDLLPFRITSFTASTSSVDLSTADATVTFDITLSELLETASDMSLFLEAPATTAPWGGIPSSRFLEGGTDPVLVSGLTYRVTRTLPAGLPAGSYSIQVYIDAGTTGLANGDPFYGGRLGVTLPGTTTAITVVNTGAEMAPPTLTSFTITPATVDATSQSVTVQLAAEATGVPLTGSIQLLLTDPLGVDAFFTQSLTHNGTSWTGSFTIPQGTRPGVFRPTLTLFGTALGRDYGYANALASTLPAGSATSFTITNASPDCMPPQIREFTFDLTTVNLAAGNVLVGGTCRITDQNDLADFVIGIDDGEGTLYPVFFQSLLSGNGQDGRYRWNMVIDHRTPSFPYQMAVFMDDGRGNFIDASTVFGTWPADIPDDLSITGSAPDNAEVKWMALQDFSGIPTADNRRLTATAINADPDRDGIPSFLEFYFGTNPADPNNIINAGNLPIPSRAGNVLRLSFGKSAANAALGLAGSTLTGQFSPDLKDWSEVPITPNGSGFRIESPALTPGSGYLRLRAKIP